MLAHLLTAINCQAAVLMQWSCPCMHATGSCGSILHVATPRHPVRATLTPPPKMQKSWYMQAAMVLKPDFCTCVCVLLTAGGYCSPLLHPMACSHWERHDHSRAPAADSPALAAAQPAGLQVRSFIWRSRLHHAPVQAYTGSFLAAAAAAGPAEVPQ
jgi:hypothetical protein